ncbi:unnamed protein product [Blepharisma stoltei]|uniref:RING-type domain-containing protein n=1 Tax=Blepharisma stoltei TaxID=1481888 RepID=A0AAU9J0R0_9CILI|nr:unnamed protein product [Blepharisma stoltei]
MNTNSIQIPIFVLTNINTSSFKLFGKFDTPSPRSVFNTKDFFNDEIEDTEICKIFIENQRKCSKSCEKFPKNISPDAECSICKVKVKASFRQFGMLSDCNDVFCLPCIRQWRGRGNVNASTAKTCPVCHKKSKALIASDFLVFGKEDKMKLLGNEGDLCRNLFKGKFSSENGSYDSEIFMQKNFCRSMS